MKRLTHKLIHSRWRGDEEDDGDCEEAVCFEGSDAAAPPGWKHLVEEVRQPQESSERETEKSPKDRNLKDNEEYVSLTQQCSCAEKKRP